jgi:hypothetical protein
MRAVCILLVIVGILTHLGPGQAAFHPASHGPRNAHCHFRTDRRTAA